ncbi:hypothetical protein HZB01_01095 [Candidatus Woesearchaeota archaeon]|nr:hypothetical protein [Candidatus Woesearchaeota archaeon]
MARATLRPLLPTLKERNRYLVFAIYPEGTLDAMSAYRAIRRSFAQLFGQIALAGAGMRFIQNEKKVNAIKISHLFLDHLKTALLFVHSINNTKVLLATKGVSGILKKTTQTTNGV